MPASLRKYTASALFAAAIISCLIGNAAAIERVVILAPAAADIMVRLGAEDTVVGVTNNVGDFPKAAKVGTHLNPGVEKVASLGPSLIVAGPRFNPELAERMGVELFVYDPRSLDAIIANVRELSRKIGKEREGNVLAGELQAVLDGLVPPGRRPTVLFETRGAPLTIARYDTVTRDLLERAGMRYAYPDTTGTISVEYLMANQPDWYIYQEGPMNKNPARPVTRRGWHTFGACSLKVSEFDFARPNTKLFETVRTLNDILNAGDPCASGAETYR